MNIISVFDTSVSTYNLGNEIIMDSVNSQLNELFYNDFIIRLPIEDIGTKARSYNTRALYTFVGGTNVLNGDIWRYRQWDLTLHNIIILRRLVLMGCGWFQYESKSPTRYTKWALSKVLDRHTVHSVRDEYTLKKCSALGIPGLKFINTGCPTLWNLYPSIISKISPRKSDSVIFTLTDYNQKPVRDKQLISQILSNYQTVYFFPQGTGDITYIKELGVWDNITIIPPRISEFDRIIDAGADYLGTRLHAGIRALQRSSRSFIIGIDNRAKEMKINFNLPVVDEDSIGMLGEIVNSDYALKLNIPWDNIRLWKDQFKEEL